MAVMAGAAAGSIASRDLVRPWAALAGLGCGCRSASYPCGGKPMFHPSRECSTNPFQVFSFSWSLYHSATPCLTRRTRREVALTPAMSAGSSVANNGDGDRLGG
jgi:hypothetical protein